MLSRLSTLARRNVKPFHFRPASSLFSTESGLPAPDCPSKVRNVAIIAHVDHGKTTLVDELMQAGLLGKRTEDRVMDSNMLEKERGITIMSKTTRVDWNDHVLNLVDTPGHADFGGEVERVLSMVDGAILVVDATEGVMSQTKFVVSKALAQGLKFVVVLNKADRDSARLNGDVENEVFDLLCNMDASDDQLEFPVVFASAKEGWAVTDMSHPREDMLPLLRHLVDGIPPPNCPKLIDQPFGFSVNNISADKYLGKLITGKVETGKIEPGMKVKTLTRSGQSGPLETITHVFCMNGTERIPVPSAQAGDIVVLAGVSGAGVSDTVCDSETTEPIKTVAVTPPTIAMSFGANDGPLCGKSGGVFLNSSQVKDRLNKEIENNVTIQLKPSPDSDQIEVHGRGELQLGIMIEEMRREGFELCVSPPRVLSIKGSDGKSQEPIEEVTIDVDQEHSGIVIERLQLLRSPMLEYKEMGDRVRMIFEVPSRHLMGVRSTLRNDTHGSAVVNSIFLRYDTIAAINSNGADKGRLVSMEQGQATSYALNMVEARGTLFIKPGDEVYEGMVIGENSRPEDMDVNPCKAKKMTNVRSVTADEAIRLSPPRIMTLEDYITYMKEDEILEVTPNGIRLRKRLLDASQRARAQRHQRKSK